MEHGGLSSVPANYTQKYFTWTTINSDCGLIYRTNVPGGTNSITVGYGNYQGYISGIFVEMSPVTTIDLSQDFHPSGSVTLPSTITGTTTSQTSQANEMAFYVLSCAQSNVNGSYTFTPSSGWTTLFQETDDTTYATGICGYQSLTSIQNVSVSITRGPSSSDYPNLGIFTFK